MAQGVWTLRRLGAQEPLRVGCPRVCIELMYQSSGYPVLGLTLNKLLHPSINHHRQAPFSMIPTSGP